MYWYVIPIYEKNIDGHPLYVPGAGDPVVMEATISVSFVLHAAMPNDVPTVALLGVVEAVSPVPDGWVAQTLVEAQTYFELVTGLVPSDQEVF